MKADRTHIAFAVVVALTCVSAAAAEITGVVIKVTSGDTLLFDTGRERFNVKLAAVTAPPAQTALADRSRASLASICYAQAATLVVTGTALDGGTIANVSCAGRDAAQEQVRRGFAKLNEPFAQGDSLLSAAEREARSSRVGVWAD